MNAEKNANKKRKEKKNHDVQWWKE